MDTFVAVLAALAALSGAGVSADVPPCDPKIIGKMSSLYPNGLPTNILNALKEQMSYVLVSEDEARMAGVKATCIGISVKNKQASVTYKMPLLPAITKKFPVDESVGFLTQIDGGTTYYLYLLFMDPSGTMGTMRCCPTCKGTNPNVGVAVINKKAGEEATLKAVRDMKDKLTEMGLGQGLTTLKPCS